MAIVGGAVTGEILYDEKDYWVSNETCPSCGSGLWDPEAWIEVTFPCHGVKQWIELESSSACSLCNKTDRWIYE